MKRIITLLALLFATPAFAQQFPTMPSNTFVCRTAIGTGPGQACPFASMQTILFGNTSANTVFAGPTSGGTAPPTFRSLIAADFASTGANTILAGPTSGGSAVPTFRSLVNADFAAAGLRTALSGNTTLFVRPDGNDTTCNGTVNVSAASAPNCAWLSPQNAVNVLKAKYDLAGFQATVQLGDGSGGAYTSTGVPVIYISGPFLGAQAPGNLVTPSSCPVIFKGNTSTPSNVVLQSTTDTILVISSFVCFQDMNITSIGGTSDMVSAGGAVVRFGNIIFGQSAGSKIRVSHGAAAENYSSFTMQGNSSAWFEALDAGGVYIGAGTTNVITIGNSHTVSKATVYAYDGGNVTLTPGVVAGIVTGGFTVTGPRFFAASNGSISDGATNVPGSLPGTTAGSATGLGSYNALPIQTTIFAINASDAAGPNPAAGAMFVERNIDGTSTVHDIQAFGSSVAPSYYGRMARGTAGSPSAAQQNDMLSVWAGYGYGATGFNAVNSNAGWIIAANQNFTDANQGTRMDCYTTANGSATLTKRCTIDADGGFWMANATGASQGQGTGNFHTSANVDGVPLITGASPNITKPNIIGTVTNDNAAAGSVGEYIFASCSSANATVTITIASPAVITYTAHGITANAGTCPIVFTTTGTLPTGIVAGTVYWILPTSIATNTFQIATSIANALAGTAINTSGSQSGTQTGTLGLPLTTATAANVGAVSLTAGDWDCGGNIISAPNIATNQTYVVGYISPVSATFAPTPVQNGGMISGWAGSSTGQGIIGGIPNGRISLASTTTMFLEAFMQFTINTQTGYGFIGCRRRR